MHSDDLQGFIGNPSEFLMLIQRRFSGSIQAIHIQQTGVGGGYLLPLSSEFAILRISLIISEGVLAYSTRDHPPTAISCA